MSERLIMPVILSGGSGTRLWPLSRRERPKQFLPLVGDETLFQQTLRRLDDLGDAVAPPIVVCNELHRTLVAEQLAEIGIEPQAIVLEPVGRNTAPAVGVAALLAVAGAGMPGSTDKAVREGADVDDVAEVAERTDSAGTTGGAEATARAGTGDLEAPAGADAPTPAPDPELEPEPEPLLLVLPADHVIRDTPAFLEAVRTAVEAAATGRLVTFGVVPDRPETGYGYLRSGASQGEWCLLEEFVEKPDNSTAERYVASGRYLWNSGMFVFRAADYLAELGRHAPDILACCEAALAEATREGACMRLGAAFEACRADSIDYAVMEKTSSAGLVPLDAGWSDVGSWAALFDVLTGDAAGNVARGRVATEDCLRTHIVATSRLVGAVGLEDVVVVETPEAVLVMPRERAQALKLLVEKLDEHER